jgi:non-ribosomal peptide synthetase component F
MIVGVLAILKAGGAYVPLDSGYSSGRLCDILMDASPDILIADRHGQQALGDDILTSMTVVNPTMEADCDSKRYLCLMFLLLQPCTISCICIANI